MLTRLDRPLWDRVGIIATTACALHCLLMPLLLPLLMVSGLAVLADPLFERWVLGATLALAGIVLWHGYRHHHHRRLPLLFGGLGALIYGGKGTVDTSWEPVVLALGATCIVTAHFLNLRYTRTAQKAGCPHPSGI